MCWGRVHIGAAKCDIRSGNEETKREREKNERMNRDTLFLCCCSFDLLFAGKFVSISSYKLKSGSRIRYCTPSSFIYLAIFPE